MPLALSGMGLVFVFEEWKKVRLEKRPAAIKAEKSLARSIRILTVAIITLLFSAIVGTALRTGFSLLYATPLLLGTVLTLLGVFWGAFGLMFARRDLRKSLGQPDQ